jgi:biotin carboxylase
MIKMVDFRSSANVYRVTSESHLEQAWDAITTNRLSLDVPYPLARVAILEEFAGGRGLTAEGYESGGRVVFLNFCEKVTSDRFIVIDHYVPAELPPAERACVEEAAGTCVRALGVRNSVFHVELHLVDGKPYVIECAARPPGSDIVIDMIRWAHGDDLLAISIDLSAGQPVDARYKDPRGHYAVLSVYSNESGRLVGLTGLAELRRRGGVREWHLTAKLGDRVEALTDFRHQYGSVVLEADTAEDLREKAEWLRRNLRLLVAGAEADGSDQASAERGSTPAPQLLG